LRVKKGEKTNQDRKATERMKGMEEHRKAERDIYRSGDKKSYSCNRPWRPIGL
jgi:hypothetical protein